MRTCPGMDGFLSAEGCEELLVAELQDVFPEALASCEPHGIVLRQGSLSTLTPLPWVAFSRQFLPNVRQVHASSVNAWAREICKAVKGLPGEGGWILHLEPQYAMPPATSISSGARALHTELRHSKRPGHVFRSPRASIPNRPQPGTHRCELILHQVQEQLRRFNRSALRRSSQPSGAFKSDDSLIQALLVSPEVGFISVAPAPIAFQNRHLISPFAKGHVAVSGDRLAPSRAFTKLVEAQTRLGRWIRPGNTCVDLGASPGSWTYVAAQSGASVISVDRSELRADLMRHKQVRFVQADAFLFTPEVTMDWLLCDVIADPALLTGLLVRWLQQRWCRAFVFTIKLKLSAPADVLAVLRTLKRQVPPLCSQFMLMRLETNKHEVCAFGTAA